MTSKSSSRTSAGLVFFGMLAFAKSAQGNVMVPMLFFIWPAVVLFMTPAALILLVLIVVLETEIGRRLLQMEPWRWWLVSGTANTASTLLGVPLTYMLAAPTLGFLNLLYGSTAESLPGWLIPLTVVIFCTPYFYFTSVGIEYVVARQIVTDEQRSYMRTWSWRANTASYGILTLLSLLLLFGYYFSQ